MDKTYRHLPYRPCVGIALFNNDGQVFVGERIDTRGAWQMPQGGVDPGETVRQAALREMEEEIGTSKAEILKICDETFRYDLPPHLMGRLWDGQYRGQEQIWIAARFTGQNGDINIGAGPHAEFKAWKWVDIDGILSLIVPFKHDTYIKVIDRFRQYARPLETVTADC